jgi:hypothetical protein
MLCAAVAGSACNRDSGTSPQPAPTRHVRVPVVAKKGPTAAELTKGMVEAVGQGKSQVAVELKFDLRQRPKLGQPLDIDIAVLPQTDAGGAQIQITGGDGLSVAATANQIDLPVVEAGQVYRQSINVTPTADGVLLLGLTISLKHDEMSESRAFSIPLVVER